MKNFGLTLILIFLALVLFYFFVLKPEKYIQQDLFTLIKERGYIKVGINIDSKPFGFVDKNGDYAGYDVDFANYIAKQLPINPLFVEIIPVTPANRMLMLSTGEVDMVISTMTITPQRAEIVDFSIPYDAAGQALLVKSNSKIVSLNDLSNQNVGVVWGTTAEKNIHILIPSTNVIGFKSYKEAYEALKNDKIIALTSDDTILSRFAFEDNTVKLLPKRYSREPYGIAFKKGTATQRLQEEVNNAIINLNEKNVITRLRKKWLG